MSSSPTTIYVTSTLTPTQVIITAWDVDLAGSLDAGTSTITVLSRVDQTIELGGIVIMGLTAAPTLTLTL